MGPPLEFLPYHRDDRFPRSAQEPNLGSRHLYAGRRPGSMQVSPELILECSKPPVLTSSIRFRHLISGSLSLVSLNLTCHDLCHDFSLTLTTMALYHSSLRWFGACSCKPTPRDLPSSFVQPRGALFPKHVDYIGIKPSLPI